MNGNGGLFSIAEHTLNGCGSLERIWLLGSVSRIEGKAERRGAPKPLIVCAPKGGYVEQYCKDNGIIFEESGS